MDKSIERQLPDLYGTPSEKVAAVTQIASLCKDDVRAIEHVVESDQLMSALARLLEEDANVGMSFIIAKVMLAVSMVEDFHEVLANHRVGSIILRVIELELKRSSGHCDFTTRQEHFLFICLSILHNLADNNDGTLRKMVKKGLVPIVASCMNVKSAKTIIISLRLLKLSSVFEETVAEIATQEQKVISKLVGMLNVPYVNIQSDIISILFNLSFLDQCFDLISNKDVHKFLVDSLDDEELNLHAVSLAYHLSSMHENRQKFFVAGLSEYLIKAMKTNNKKEMNKAMAGLLVNMTLLPLCAEYFVRNCAIDFVMSAVRDESTLDFNLQVLLKVARNMSVWSRSLQCKIVQALKDQELSRLEGHVEKPASYIDVTQQRSLYWEQNFWNAHVPFLWSCTFQCDNEDIVVELVGILSNMTIDDLSAGNQWHNLMEDCNSEMMQFLKRILDPNDCSVAPCCDDLKLEVIVWLGELSSDKECSCWVVNVLDDVNHIFTQSFVRRKDDDLSIAILCFYEQLLLHEETRFQVIGADGVLDAILNCLEDASLLGATAAKCLIIVENLDRNDDGSLGDVGCYIQERRFALVNEFDELDS